MSAIDSPGEDTAARLCVLGGMLALALTLGCAGVAELPEVPPDAGGGALSPGSVRVRLVFGADADLDLYVTDPRLETVYFANTPIRSGGAIGPDRRCESASPRIEQVTFRDAPRGRYRVGVDFPRRCRLAVGSVPFLVIVEIGAQRIEQRGEVDFARFEPRVLDFDVGGSDSAP